MVICWGSYERRRCWLVQSRMIKVKVRLNSTLVSEAKGGVICVIHKR